MSLIAHCGAELISREQLIDLPCPPETETWKPVPHIRALALICENLDNAGFTITKESLAVTRHGQRFFGTLDLRSELAPGVNLAVGVRNSVDQSLPLGFCAGSRVFVCDNLAFRSDLIVKRKHTKNGELRFDEAISRAVQSLPQFMAGESQRIIQMRETELNHWEADSLLLQSYERKIVSHRLLPDCIRAWREPSDPEFELRTRWSLFNAFTQALKPKVKSNPQEFALQTMKLYGLLCPSEN